MPYFLVGDLQIATSGLQIVTNFLNVLPSLYDTIELLLID